MVRLLRVYPRTVTVLERGREGEGAEEGRGGEQRERESGKGQGAKSCVFWFFDLSLSYEVYGINGEITNSFWKHSTTNGPKQMVQNNIWKQSRHIERLASPRGGTCD